jgi:hypothetical protein
MASQDGVSPFMQTGREAIVLDLRALTGAARAWFSSAHILREFGTVYYEDESLAWAAVAASRFDALIFVRNTTRARSLKPAVGGPPLTKP